MPARVVFSKMALDDLDGIWAFYAIDCDSPKAADRTVQGVLDSLDRLSDLPESGTPLDSRCIVHSDYRFVVSGHHLAFYRHVDDCVYIDRVLDGRSDYLRQLFGLPDSGIDFYVQPSS